MLGSILNGIQIKNEIPDAVGYCTFGPFEFPIPDELKSTNSEEELNSLADISILYFDLDNHSPKVQNDIRIIYSGEFQYTPKFNYGKRNVAVDFEIQEDLKEIHIKELLPNESLSISFFNTSDSFNIEQVIIGEKMITDTMNRLAELRRSPSLKWPYLFMITVLVLAFGSTAYTTYSMQKSSELNRLVKESYKNLGYMECLPELFDNAIGNEKKLERKYQQLSKIQQDNTLILNSVLTYQKLKNKEQILFCIPNNP